MKKIKVDQKLIKLQMAMLQEAISHENPPVKF